MNDVDDESVRGSAHRHRPGAYQERDGVEQVWQVPSYVQTVVERQHQLKNKVANNGVHITKINSLV